MATSGKAERTARAHIREWVREQIDGVGDIHIPTLRDSAFQAFSRDQKFMTRLAEETLRQSIYDVIQSTVTATRMVQIGDEALTPEAVEERAEGFASRFLSWMEHNGTKHVRVMDATREDLMSAASIRRARGSHELRVAALWEGIAAKLEGGQRVGECFTAEEIEAMYERINRETSEEGAA